MTRSGRGTCFALLVLASSLVATAIGGQATEAEATALFELTDPPQDTWWEAAEEEVPAPHTQEADAVDLLAFRLLEDTPGWLVGQIDFAGIPATGPGSSLLILVDFSVADPPTRYRASILRVSTDHAPEGAPIPLRADVCIQDIHGKCLRPYQFAKAFAYPEKAAIGFEIPKASLLGRAPTCTADCRDDARQAAPARLDAGTRLQDWHVEARRNGAIGYRDMLPNPGTPDPAYAMATPAANTIIQVAMGTESVDPVRRAAFDADAPAIVPLVLSNLADSKRILTLRVHAAAHAEELELDVAAVIEVPALAPRRIDLHVRPLAPLEHGASRIVHVEAASAGFPQEAGWLTLELVAARPPTHPQDTLSFHVNPALREIRRDQGRWLNTMVQDPQADGEARHALAAGSSYCCPPARTWSIGYELDTPLWPQSRLEPQSPLAIALALRSTMDFPGTLTATVTNGETHWATFTAEGAFDDGQWNLYQQTLISASAAAAVDPEQGVRVHIQVRTEDAAASTTSPALDLWLDAQASSLTVPIQAPPWNPDDLASPLVLDANVDPDELVNPGIQRNVSIVATNAGETTLPIVATIQGPQDWRIQVLPGPRYQLAPGQSVTMILAITAPETAIEGHNATTRLEVRAMDSGDTLGSLQVRWTVVTGVILPAQAGLEHDADTLSRVLGPPQGTSPGPAAMATSLVLLALAGWRGLTRESLPTRL